MEYCHRWARGWQVFAEKWQVCHSRWQRPAIATIYTWVRPLRVAKDAASARLALPVLLKILVM